MILKADPPNIQNNIMNFKKKIFSKINNLRMIPYPPNFNRIPAKIIDPLTGASTCALGNHWWKKKWEILPKKI